MAILVAALTGCVATELRVTNHSGSSIQFFSGHTQKSVSIPLGATVTVPHTSGKAIIAQRDVVWTYDSVDVFDFPSETSKGFKRVTLPIVVQSNGVVSLPSGRKIEPSHTSYH